MPEVTEEIVRTPDQLAKACEILSRCPRIGFDTEFVGEETYVPRLCLVQVAIPGRLYLLDPFFTGPLDAFWTLLHDPGRQVIVHAGREEVRLCRLWSGQAPANLFDLQLAAGLVGPVYPLGHGPLVQQALGIRLQKGETLTEWRRRPLTTEQIRYAFDDVRYLLPCCDKLTDRLQKLNRLDWATEEFQRLARTSGPDDTGAEEKWRKLRGLGALDRRKLAVVRALFAWREERAAQVNRPARTVVRDDLLVEIARRNPSKAKDLQVVRGLQQREVDAIIGVVQEARRLPLEHCPEQPERDQDPPQVALVQSILSAVLGDLCARMQLSQSLVGSNADLKLLIRARMNRQPWPDECGLVHGWRGAHVLPELVAVLEGRKSVHIADLRTGSPLGVSIRQDSSEG